MKQVTYTEMDYCEFEQLVKTTYGHDYEFPEDIECGNDSEHTYEVTGELDEWDRQKLQEFVQSGKYLYLAPRLLNDLVARGKLPKGRYLITVCW